MARKMATSFAAHPNIMSYLFSRRRAQVEIDARIFPSRLYGDEGSYRAAFRKTHFIDACRQHGCIMAVEIGAVDNRRNLSGFFAQTVFRRL